MISAASIHHVHNSLSSRTDGGHRRFPTLRRDHRDRASAGRGRNAAARPAYPSNRFTRQSDVGRSGSRVGKSYILSGRSDDPLSEMSRLAAAIPGKRRAAAGSGWSGKPEPAAISNRTLPLDP